MTNFSLVFLERLLTVYCFQTFEALYYNNVYNSIHLSNLLKRDIRTDDPALNVIEYERRATE